MPTFDRLLVPVLAALLIGGLTGVLAAQTGQTGAGQQVAAAINKNANNTGGSSLPALQSDDGASSVRKLFTDGVDAYRSGDLDKALVSWKAAAEAGDIAAQWNLARLYLDGDEIAIDRAKALGYLREVAGAYDPDLPPGPRVAITTEALVDLGVLFWEGVPEAGLEASPETAARLFEQAATLYGHSRAQHYLGVMYLKGEGVKQHVGRAVRWFILAANKRYAPAQAALGDYFWSKKMDAAGNRIRGLMWLALAIENSKGAESRAQFVDRYNTILTEVDDAERDKVAQLIDSWNARYPIARK